MTLLYRGLHLAGVYRLTKTTLLFSLKLLISGTVMIGVILWQLDNMQLWLDWGFNQRALTLTGLIALGAFAYIVSILFLGIRVKHLKAATD
jgi:putative peptidoglycan lipid II flippase